MMYSRLRNVYGKTLNRFRHHTEFAHPAAIYNFPLRNYSQQIDPNIITSPYSNIVIPNCTINDYIWQNLDRWPDKTAMVCGETGRGFTYSQLYRMTVSFAASLRSKLKLCDGDCVAIMLPNMPEYPVAALGAIQAGCVVTTVNPVYTALEVQRQLELSNVKLIVTTMDVLKTVTEAVNKLPRKIPIIVTRENREITPGLINFAEFAEDFSVDTDCLKSVKRNSDDLAFLPYSSGTTGLTKGVEITHRNIVASCQQIIDEKIVGVEPTTGAHQDVLPGVLPFFHIFGLVVVMVNHLLQGCKVVTLPRFAPDLFLKVLLQHRATSLFLVPPVALFLGSHPAVSSHHLQYLRSITCGAAPFAVSDAARLMEKGSSDLFIRQGYGLTESTSVVSVPSNTNRDYGTTGPLVAQTEAKVVSMDTGESLAPNQTGELWVRGPQIMRGYYNNAQANEEVFSGDWFKTGDIAHYDEKQNLYITDRLKELIKVKGFQVPPAELEGILRSHPLVMDAAVVGIAHATAGELPKAFVVAKPGARPDAEEIKAFVADKVASYKKIAVVEFVDSIPKNAAGKILRKNLKNN